MFPFAISDMIGILFLYYIFFVITTIKSRKKVQISKSLLSFLLLLLFSYSNLSENGGEEVNQSMKIFLLRSCTAYNGS